ncbi:hypothetical protein ADUPG1_012274 [Aduncisulcus paluster]|uniref:Uncharacterized protein n=1 Tax=Aduncisulcus paluster TaxID=2918883 RepID=A0ABQ5JYW9_9EUKA|nr:hypothetical protein ADUPG1_012274 [Aduncisulcus paluster]
MAQETVDVSSPPGTATLESLHIKICVAGYSGSLENLVAILDLPKTVDKELEVNLTDLALDHMTFYAQKPYSKSSITLTELAGLATNGESLSERNQAAKDLQTRMSHKKHNADSLVRDGKSGKAYSRCNDTSPVSATLAKRCIPELFPPVEGSSISWQTIDKVPAWESSSILSVSTELIKKTLDRIHNTAISGVTGITGQAFKLACNNDHGRAFSNNLLTISSTQVTSTGWSCEEVIGRPFAVDSIGTVGSEALSFLKKIVAWYGNPKQRISSKEGDKAVYMTRLRLLRRRIGQAVLMRAFGSADKAISKLLDRAGFTKRARASMAFL